MDEAAGVSRERPKLFAVERSSRLRALVWRRLRRGWSPASIAGRLPISYPDDQACRVSREAIYQWAYVQPVHPGQGADQSADWAKGSPWRASSDAGAADPRAPLHRRTPRRGHRPGTAWALGGRSCDVESRTW